VDETYLCPIFEEDVIPLLRTDAPMVDEVHTSALATLQARNGGRVIDTNWHHPPGSSLAAWCREVGTSRWVYIQPGDTPETLRNEGYQTLVEHALAWTMG